MAESPKRWNGWVMGPSSQLSADAVSSPALAVEANAAEAIVVMKRAAAVRPILRYILVSPFVRDDSLLLLKSVRSEAE